MVFSFKRFVEKELGKFPHFLIYAVLEWTLIIIIFLDGFLAFIANQFAKLFELEVPCLLCTRVDHVLVRRNPDFYYNDSICVAHKKNVSTLAFCHVHKKLSNVKKMCERCLISFATEKESGCDMYKSLVGILHKDIEMIGDEDQLDNQPPKNSNSSSGQQRPTIDRRCCCCGEPLKVRSFNKTKNVSFFNTAAAAPSPRAPYSSFKNHREPIRNLSLDFSNLKSAELKLMDNDEYDDRTNLAMVREDQEGKTTPSGMRGNKFFGIPLKDSPCVTPRLASRLGRKSMLERAEFASASDSSGVIAPSDHGGDNSILHYLRRQVNKEQKSLINLYMELDEERHASEVAANNAMAMITRLQAEKAAVRMEALQYQRMMEEQAEYDQEALQALDEMLTRREEEMRELEVEVEAYRSKYGCLEEFEVQADEKHAEGFRVVRPPSFTNSSPSLLLGSPEYGSPVAAIEEEPPPPPPAPALEAAVVKSGKEKEESNGGGFSSSSEIAEKMQQQQMDRSRFLGRLRNLDKKLEIADNRERSSDDD